MQNSSSSKKTVGIVIVILIVIAGIWLMTRKSGSDYSNTASSSQTDNDMSGMNMQQPSGTTGAGTSGTGTSSVSSTDTSDAALNQDAASIDAQMNGLNSDSAAAQQSAQ